MNRNLFAKMPAVAEAQQVCHDETDSHGGDQDQDFVTDGTTRIDKQVLHDSLLEGR